MRAAYCPLPAARFFALRHSVEKVDRAGFKRILGPNHYQAIVLAHLLKHLQEIQALPEPERLQKRYEKFRAFGHFIEKEPAAEPPKA